MLSKERLNYITQRVSNEAGVEIKTLAKELNVSLSTIQRDLRKLEAMGALQRDRGGVLSKDYPILSAYNEVATSAKKAIDADIKEALAAYAASLIQDGECIFIGSGSSVAYLAHHLINRKITIVSDSLFLNKQLNGFSGKLIMVGGTYDERYDMFIGSLANDNLKRMNYDKAFISCSGVDLKQGKVKTIDTEIGMMKQSVMQNASQSYLLLSSAKFDLQAVDTFAQLSDFDEVICDKWPAKLKKPRNIKIVETGEKL